MKTNKRDIRWIVGVALMSTIIILLSGTPLGLIQLPVIKITTVHVPVIIGSIFLGPLGGGILGFVFGICSMINNTIYPTLFSFAFSPFLSTTGILGAIKALWISIGCRIIIGVVAGWLWIFLRKIKIKEYISFVIVGFIGSMVNTVMVMGSIYFLLAKQYAEAKQVGITSIYGLIMDTITGAGVIEAIFSMIAVTLISKALLINIVNKVNEAKGIDKN